MNITKRIFSGLLIAVFATNSVFAARNNCDNANYRHNNPEKCRQFDKNHQSNTFLAILGGAALVGTGVALATQTSGDSGSASAVSNQATFPRLTLSSNININYDAGDLVKNQKIAYYYTTGASNNSDIDDATIQNIKSSDKYQRNYRQYDSINFAWATARDFTGQGVDINILDDFKSYHGNVVYDLINNISPGANTTTYNISYAAQKLNSFDSIAETLKASQPAHIYNASWQITASDTQNAATAIYNQKSIKTYAMAQDYLYNATSENFITQIRNTAVDNDAIFVWAAGNESKTESGVLSAMPLAFPELQGHFVNVVALDSRTNEIAWYSNQCGITQNYCIAAPGSGWDTDSLDFASGTSFATPVVSGAIATIKQAFPYMSATQITQLLFVTAQDMGAPGVDEVYGWGLLDMDKATQPVGEAKIVLSNNTVQPLSVSNVSGTAAGALKNANLQIAFVDDFGRAFTTNLSNNINVIPYGRGFDKLRESDNDSIDLFGGFEFGAKQNNLLQSSGLISTKSNTPVNFIGYKNEFNIDNIRFYQNARLGITNPTTDENSIISGFSSIYTSSLTVGANWGDLSFEFGIPDMIISGKMFLDIPTGQSVDGKILHNNIAIDMTTTPSSEYTLKYKNLSMTYVNNPYYQDEFFIMAKGRFTF